MIGFNLLVKFRFWFFLFTGLILSVSLFLIKKPQVSGNLGGLEVKDIEEYRSISRVDSIFGNSDNIYLIVFPISEDRKVVFDELTELQNDLIKQLPEVRIVSPVTIFKKMRFHWKQEIRTIPEFYEVAKDVPLLTELIARDKKSLALGLFSDSNNITLTESVNSVIKDSHFDSFRLEVLSNHEVTKAVKRQVESDIKLILIAVVVLFLVFTLLTFRSLRSGVFILFIVSVALSSTYILFGLLKIEFNVLSMIALPVVLILALSDSLHLLAGYKKNKGLPKNERIIRVLYLYFIPSFFSSLTTSLAFFTFYLFGESKNIQELGLLAAIGLLLEFLIVFSVAPFLLSFQSDKKVFDSVFLNLSGQFRNIRRPVTLGFGLILICAVVIYPSLKFESHPEALIPNETQIEKSYNYFSENYFSPFTLNILVNGSDTHSLRLGVKELADSIKSISGVKSVNASTNEFYFRNRLGRKVNLYNYLGGDNPFYDEVSNTYRIEVKLEDVEHVKVLKKEVMNITQGKPYACEVSSRKLLYDAANQEISTSLLKSIATSGLGIFLILLLLTKSFSTAILSLFPNLFPLGVVFVVMYLLGLDIFFTSTITLVIGLGLLDDDTVHIIYRRLWLRKPLEELNFSILSSALLLSSGFLVFTLSQFYPVRVFGWISVVIFISGVIAEMTTMQWVLDRVLGSKKE